METAIFHIGNAGLFFYRNGTGILIDGIYDGSKVGMSAMRDRSPVCSRHPDILF